MAGVFSDLINLRIVSSDIPKSTAASVIEIYGCVWIYDLFFVNWSKMFCYISDSFACYFLAFDALLAQLVLQK